MAMLFCRGCGKQITQTAGTGGANLCAACAKKAADPAAAVSSPAEPAASGAPALSAIPEDLELELVVPKQPPPEAQRSVPRHRLPEPVSGKPIDAGDPMRLYLVAGVALVATVLGGIWYFLREAPPAKTTTSGTGTGENKSGGDSASSGAHAKKTASASGAQKSSGSQASNDTPPAFNANNPANKRCFHAYLNFMNWAYRDGLQLKSDVLIAKYKEQVSLSGVDDPDVKGIQSRVLQVLNLGAYPLKTDIVIAKPGVDPTVARLKANEEAKERKRLLLEISSLVKNAERRYGRPPPPPPPKPAPEAKTAAEPQPEPAPGPDPEAGKTQGPPSLKPAQ